MKRAAAMILGFSMGAGFLCGTTWNATFEAIPAGSDLASTLDTVIQDFKAEVRRRASVETIAGNGTDDNGLSRLGSSRVFVQNDDPTAITGPGAYDSAGTAFVSSNLTTDEPGATTRDTGAGRLWADSDGAATGTAPLNPTTTDGNRLAIWDETADLFREVTARDQGGAGTGAQNLLYHGGFDMTDGTGATASTTVAQGWTNLSTATIGYQSVANSTEGDGIAMRTTAAGGANEGATQVLEGLKESTVYVYRARVRATAGDTCNLFVDDGTTNATDTTATTGAFETLEVQHTTTAGPADVTVALRATADTDVCDWDHVTAFERYATTNFAEAQVCRSTSTNNTDDAYNNHASFVDALVSCTVNVPGPGYIIMVRGAVHGDGDAGNNGLEGRMRENCNGAGATTVATGHGSMGSAAAGSNDVMTASMAFTKIVVEGGDQCVYTLEATGSNGVIDRNMGTTEGAGQDPLEQPITFIEAILIPTGA